MTIERRKPKKEKDNMTIKLQPLADHVVVKPIAKEEKTKSGIYIPDTAKERPQEGDIIAVGPAVLLKMASALQWTSKWAIESSTPSTAAAKSKLKTRT